MSESRQRANQANPPVYEVNNSVYKNALFNLSNSTLKGTPQWHFQVVFQLVLAFALVCYGIYWMDMTKEIKALALVSFLLVCYAAVNLSGIVRNRVESEKLMEYAHGTPLYVASNIKTLRGSDIKYGFHWSVFILAFAIMLASIWYVEMSSERRGYLCCSGIMLLNAVFIVVKDLRDQEDSEKNQTEYELLN